MNTQLQSRVLNTHTAAAQQQAQLLWLSTQQSASIIHATNPLPLPSSTLQRFNLSTLIARMRVHMHAHKRTHKCTHTSHKFHLQGRSSHFCAHTHLVRACAIAALLLRLSCRQVLSKDHTSTFG